MDELFVRDRLPGWERYVREHDIALRGSGSERRMRCSVHGGGRDSLSVNVETGVWQCHACGAKGADVLAYHRASTGASFEQAARELGAWDDDNNGEQRKAPAPAAPRCVAASKRHDPCPDTTEVRKRALAARLWAQALPIEEHSPVGAYLRGRSCVLPPADGDLRWLPALQLFGFEGPAMVGLMTSAADYREVRGLHITWLAPDAAGWRRGERRYLGPKVGCVVRLWPDEAVASGLGVAEGIETALSMAHGFEPVWATMDAGNLGALPVLLGIEALTIAADHDEAGLRAADACGRRWAAAGVDVRIAKSERPGEDINDVARRTA